MKLKPEDYKGYAIKFTQKSLPNGNQAVQGTFASQITKKILGSMDVTKEKAFISCKKLIDKECKMKGD